MSDSYSVTLPVRENELAIIRVGDKIKTRKRIVSRRTQNQEMVHRLRKKKFKAIFIVTSVRDYNDYTSFNIKPYNF